LKVIVINKSLSWLKLSNFGVSSGQEIIFELLPFKKDFTISPPFYLKKIEIDYSGKSRLYRVKTSFK
jgi:hypothetical protein